MNLIIGLVIMVCLVCSEFQRDAPASDLPLRLLLIGATTLLVPGLAIFQTLFVARQGSVIDVDRREEVIRRLTACHSAVWLAASMAVILSLRWHDVVRLNWGFDRYILLDELLILAPVILSLIASWAVFYDIESLCRRTDESVDRGNVRSAMNGSGNGDSEVAGQVAVRIFRWGFSRERFQFVWLRVQFQILVIAVPLALAIVLNDLRPYLQGRSINEAVVVSVAFGWGSWILFPKLMRWIWRSVPVEVSLRSAVTKELDDRGVVCHELGRWKTNGKVVNACILGHRWDRRILVSDRLLDDFPERETRAVIRHEAGHLGLRHAPTRIAFLLIPLAAILFAGWITVGTPMAIEFVCARLNAPPLWGFVLFGIFYAGYLLVLLRWLSHGMEFEADLYASCVVAGRAEKQKGILRQSAEMTFSSELACDMSEALLRLAAYHLPQFERATLFHPSIRSRIESLQVIESGAAMSEVFARTRRTRWICGIVLWVTMTMVMAGLLMVVSVGSVPS